MAGLCAAVLASACLFDEAPCADNNEVSPFGFDLMPIPKSDKPAF